MPKKPKPKKTGRVSFVSVSRLYNLGNYQNVKYELAAEIAKGESPSETLIKLTEVILALRPISPPDHALVSLKAARKKKLSERSEYEKENFSSWLEAERDYRQKIDARRNAVLALDLMGGSSVSTDHKQNWDDTPW